MTDRDRLINLMNFVRCNAECCADLDGDRCGDLDKLDRCQIEALADNLLQNGVIVPPVEVGQTVWYIKGGYYRKTGLETRPIEVTEINKKWHGKILVWGFIANGTRYRFPSIGKTVFLTREEAEKALKEREKS